MNKSGIRQDELKMRFKVGSTYFFKDYPSFISKDIDEVEFEENPKLYKYFMQFRKNDGNRCLFKWKKMSADEFVKYMLNTKTPMEIGKFLVPEVANYLGFTIEHLKQLQPVIDKLDNKHKYEKIIYDSYIENDDFYMTQEQRNTAYIIYRQERM